MKRFCAFAVLAALAATGGCAAPARFIEKKADSGVVAVPNDSDTWPNNNRRAALDLIEKHVGPNYEIIDERTVPTGRTTRATRPDTDHTLNPRNPALPAQRPTSPNAIPQEEITEYRITYRKTAAEPFGNNANGGGATVVQTQYPAAGTGSGVQPAGGVRPGGPLSVFNRNPGPATGGADCKE